MKTGTGIESKQHDLANRHAADLLKALSRRHARPALARDAAAEAAALTDPTSPILIASLMRGRGSTGLQTHVRAYQDALAQQGQKWSLATPFSRPLWQTGISHLMRWSVHKCSPAAAVRWHRYWHGQFLEAALRQQLRSLPQCVLYAQCPVSAAAALRARWLPTQRVVMAVHFNISQADEWAEKGYFSLRDRLYADIRREEENLLPRLDGLVFVSRFMRDALCERIPAIRQVRSIVLPNFVPDPGPQRTSDTDGDLISIGSLEPRKNQSYLLDILASANAVGRKIRLTLAGDGPDRSRLESRARTLGIKNQVRFIGYVGNAPTLLARHRGYIHAATMENLPLTLVESLSYGSPVFAPAVGGIPEIFEDGIEGRWLPLNDPHAAASIVTDWLDSPGCMKRAGQAARSRYLQNFESTLVAVQLTAFLQSVQPGNPYLPPAAPTDDASP